MALEAQGLYNNAYRITKLQSDNCFALPLSQTGIKYFGDLICTGSPFPETFEGCFLKSVQLQPSKKEVAKAHSEHKLLYKAMEQYLNHFQGQSSTEKDELLSELPLSWERHGDLVILSSNAFRNRKWTEFSNNPTKDGETIECTSKVHACHFWSIVASALKCKRLAIDNRVKCDKFRSSGATLVLGEEGWVEHIDNGIKYKFDVTKIMFSSGNITEKLRVAAFCCKGETVLDLYAGIGYFTLPYLVHARAELVHACEWNSNAVEALERGLKANGVKERCIVHYGDNRKVWGDLRLIWTLYVLSWWFTMVDLW